MRRVVGALRSDDADRPPSPSATLAALDALARQSCELGLLAHVSIEAGGASVPVGVAQSVYRIVRESLTNARRHATGATAVDVRVVNGASSLVVVVTDDGRAQSSPQGTDGFGLT